jgi:hypothetical protein
MSINAATYLGNPARYVLYGTDVDPAVIYVVFPFFNFVFMFVILVLLFSLGIRKSKGLWSSPQGLNLPMPVAFLPHPIPGQGGPMPMQMPMQQPAQGGAQGLPAYLQYHQQQQQQQQAPQGYYYYPQQPAPMYHQQQQGGHQQQFDEQKGPAAAQTESAPAPGQQQH